MILEIWDQAWPDGAFGDRRGVLVPADKASALDDLLLGTTHHEIPHGVKAFRTISHTACIARSSRKLAR